MVMSPSQAPSCRPGRGAPGRPRVGREVRKRQMVEVAERVFGEHGFHSASMDEIARAAGITKPMLYAYFGSKEGLFAACGEAAGERLRKRVREAAQADVPPDQRLWRGLVGVFSFIEDNRELWKVHNPPGDEPAAGTIGAGAAQGRRAMGELMAELLADTAVGEGVSPEAAAQTPPLAHALTAAVIAMAEWWLWHPEEPKELQALRVMNFAWVGFESMLAGRMWLPES